MANLFDKAKAKGATAAGKPKNDKTIVEINEPGFHLSLSRLAEVNAEIDSLSAESAVLGAEVKQRAIKEYQKLYDKDLRNPGSFIIKAIASTLKSASFMFLPTDKYITINEERANELTGTYGEEIVTEKTTWIMDATLVEKYADVIGELIEKCGKITQDDKEKLISAVVKYEVTKGTIADLKTKYATKPINEVLEDIKPVYQMKNVKIDTDEMV